MRRIKKWLRTHFELLCWVSALVILFILPQNDQAASLCLFRFLGFTHCPGCGIGHSIHSALHGNFSISFHQHPLGMIAVIIIFNRIKQLVYPLKHYNETQPDQPHPRT